MANSYKFKGITLATISETALLTAATDGVQSRPLGELPTLESQ